MDPRLIALMKMAQRAKQPVRRFDDGGEVFDLGSFDDLAAVDFGNMDFGGGDFNVGDLDIASALEDVGGGIDLIGVVDDGTTAGIEDLIKGFGTEGMDISALGGGTGEAPGYSESLEYQLGGAPSRASQNLDDLLQDIENQQLADQLGGTPSRASEYLDRLTQEEAERADRYGGLYEQAMSGLTDAMQGGVYNAARDSQAANEYLERVMGVPRSEIDEAYASAQPRFVTFGGKTYETGVDRFGNYTGTPGREVKYDSKGNLVDPKTGKIVSEGPGTTTTNTIKEIIEKYTGGGGGGGGGGQQKKSDLSSLLPLLLMMLMMNRQSGAPSTASIPALSASQTQTPYGAIQQAAGYRPGQGGITYFNPIQYAPKMAGGGIADLAMMKQGGRLLHGPGDGVSDSIPATIGGRQPARLARGEYVIDARTVAELGNGSTDAGAERLDEMRQRVLSKRKQAKMGQDTKAYKHLPA